VIASGLSIGTLFTLFVVPAVYLLIATEHSRHWWFRVVSEDGGKMRPYRRHDDHGGMTWWSRLVLRAASGFVLIAGLSGCLLDADKPDIAIDVPQGVELLLENFPMTERETRITDTFQVEREDGSQETVIEQTIFLIHKGDNHSVPIQIEWYLNDDSLIRDQSDHSVFRNGITGETFRRIR